MLDCEKEERRDKLDCVQRLLWVALAMIALLGFFWVAQDWLLIYLGGFIILAIIAAWLVVGVLAWVGGELTHYLFLSVLVLSLLMAGCTDPEKVAKARQVDGSTNATATAVAVKVPATATAVYVRSQIEVETREERAAFWSAFWEGGKVGLLVVGVVGLGCVTWVLVANARAETKRAGLRARTIRVDKDTKLLPILLSADGSKAAHLGTGMGWPLWEERAPDDRLLAGDQRLKELGLLVDGTVRIAQETGQGDAGEAMIRGWIVLGGGDSGLLLPSPEENGRGEMLIIQGPGGKKP